MVMTEAVIKEYERMVFKLAWKYTGNLDLWHDLCQEGFIGLQKACDTYDPDRGAFSTHAYNRIEGQILQYVNYNIDIVHVPVRKNSTKPEITGLLEIQEMSSDSAIPSMLLDALDMLDSDMKYVLIAHYIDGRTKTELAREAGVKYQTMVTRMNRALATLKAAFEDC